MEQFGNEEQINLKKLNQEPKDINLVSSNLFKQFEEITQKTRNIKIHLHIVKMIDIFMTERFYSLGDKDIWNLIYLVNYIFDLHDIFVGSFIAQRLVRAAKRILLDMLETRGDKINQEQSYEINSLLSTEALKGSKAFLQFESDTKEIKEKFQSDDLAVNIQGIKDLMVVFGKCYDL